MSIHQEAVITASRDQIYRFLTDGEVFAAVTGQPARLGDREGEPFTLFSGRVEGRQIELVPGERVVQAWRFGSAHPDEWAPGSTRSSGSPCGPTTTAAPGSSSTTTGSRRSGRSTSGAATRCSTRAR